MRPRVQAAARLLGSSNSQAKSAEDGLPKPKTSDMNTTPKGLAIVVISHPEIRQRFVAILTYAGFEVISSHSSQAVFAALQNRADPSAAVLECGARIGDFLVEDVLANATNGLCETHNVELSECDLEDPRHPMTVHHNIFLLHFLEEGPI